MTSSVSSGKPGSRFLGFLRLAALIALLAGALGSVGFTLRAGHRNPSRALIGLFLVAYGPSSFNRSVPVSQAADSR